MIKLVVFDWNGVLIADAKATIDIDNELLRRFGRPPITLAQYRDLFTMPVVEFFYRLGFTKEEMARDAVRIQNMFHELYEPRIARVRTRSGARTLLSFLEERGIEAIILSNHTHEGIASQLKRLGIERHFSRIISNGKHDTMARKSKAEKLVDLMGSLPYEREEALIIGDSTEEIEAARAAGIRSVAITGGYYSATRLKAARPDFLIHSLPGMIEIIKKL